MYGIQPTLVSTVLYSLVHTPQVNLGRERCEVPASKVHLLQSLWVISYAQAGIYPHTFPTPHKDSVPTFHPSTASPDRVGLGTRALAHMVCARTCVCLCPPGELQREGDVRGQRGPGQSSSCWVNLLGLGGLSGACHRHQ